MSEAATDDQAPAGPTVALSETGAVQPTTPTQDVAATGDETPNAVGMGTGETAREVAARHFARLMYTPVSTWSRYVFHENEPHPFASSPQARSRGK